MAMYVKVDHPDYDWKKCIDESQRMMSGHKGELFVLDLSFIGRKVTLSFAPQEFKSVFVPFDGGEIKEFFLTELD